MPAEGARARRAREVRSRLRRAGMDVFARDGFVEARIVDIVEQAGVGVGTFYRHYDSKSALLLAIIDEVTLEAHFASSAGTERPLVDQVRLANEQFLDHYATTTLMYQELTRLSFDHPEFRQVYLHLWRHQTRRITSSILKLQAEGRADPSIDARVAADALAGMVYHSAQLWFGMGEPVDRDAAVDTLTTLWVNALRIEDRPI